MKFKKTLSAFLASILALGALSLPANAQSVSTDENIRTYQAASAVPAPIAVVNSGTYITSVGMTVLFLPVQSTDQIWYSVNGTGFRRLTDMFMPITQNSVIRVYALRGGQRSETKTYTYNLIPEASISLKNGVYNGVQRIFVETPVKDAKICYTTDGSIPNERSEQYSPSTGILVKKTGNVKVAVIKSGWTIKYLSNTYIILNPQNTPDDPLDDGGLIKQPAESAVSKSKLDNFKGKWLYGQLTSSQKAAYERIFNASKEHAASVDLSDLKIKENDLNKAYWACDHENPQFLANGSGYRYSYNPVTGVIASVAIQYGRTENQIKSVETSFKNTIDSVVKAADTKINDYEKIKYIHDWIIDHTRYNKTAGAFVSEADGAVVYGKALCEGYSKAFMYLAQELGYDCICVTGDVGTEGHMWNMIKIGGQWYHVDVTHDDPIMSDGSDACFYDYFLVSTSEIRKTRTIDTDLNIPNALRSY